VEEDIVTETCIDPTGINEGDLMAYVDGTADQAVIEHIRRCPACARQARGLAALQTTLTVRLYRASCPTPDQLIAYQQGELRGGEELTVAQHLRKCPHCARELAALAHEEGEDANSGERSWAAIEVRIAPGMIHPAPQVCQLCDTEVGVTQHASQTHPGRWDISGRVQVGGQVPESVDGTTVELYQDGELVATSMVSPRGQFTFRDLEPGGYHIHLM
jgi:anti-sigma factor RsiW